MTGYVTLHRITRWQQSRNIICSAQGLQGFLDQLQGVSEKKKKKGIESENVEEKKKSPYVLNSQPHPLANNDFLRLFLGSSIC